MRYLLSLICSKFFIFSYYINFTLKGLTKIKLCMKQDNQHKTEIWLYLWYKNQINVTIVALLGPISPLKNKYYCIRFLNKLTVTQTDLRNSSYAWNKTVNPLICLSAIFCTFLISLSLLYFSLNCPQMNRKTSTMIYSIFIPTDIKNKD